MQFDKFADADGPVEVQVAHGRGNAVTGTPLRGGGVGGGVDPLQECAAVADGLDVETVSCLMADSVRLKVLFGLLGQDVHVAVRRSGSDPSMVA
jgi:hypothetical protein